MPFDNLSFGHVDADTRTLRAAMTVPPPPGRLWQIDQTIRQLKQHGIWQKLDVLWMLAAHDAQAARLNWKNPSQFALTAVNSPTFTTDRGYAGNGTTSYLDTNWNPATVGVNFVRNDALFGFYSRTAAQHAGSDAGWVGTVGTTIDARNASDQATFRINQSAADTIAVASGDGLYAAVRTGASSTVLYKNGLSLTTGTQASTAIESNNFYVGRVSNVGFSSIQFASALAGGSLSAAQHAALYRITQNHLASMGAAV